MDRRQLTSFVALSDDLHFSRAAARLRITQPALSQQIARLEAELNVRLFSRGPKHVALTDAGRIFLEEATETLRRMDQAVARVRSAAAGRIGRLTIAFVEAAPVLPDLVAKFNEAVPEVSIDFREMVTAEQIDALADGRVDVGILRPITLGRGLEYFLIHREPYLVALPLRHPLAAREAIRLRDLDGQRLITRPAKKRRYVEGRFRARLEKAKIALPIAHEVDQLHTMLGLVGAGLGVAILPESMSTLRMGGVVYRPFAEGQAPNAELAVAWRTGNRSQTLARLIAIARAGANAI
ncbi:MAG: LysR family transcriptional regulator [Alphaproteobacteria bacterium]|nr:LysR family transcriptional regulator [Alphaproteobacteria bacterium]